MKRTVLILTLIFSLQLFSQTYKVREFVDTVGFAHKTWQMDSVIKRISRLEREELAAIPTKKDQWKTIIAPHDDYTYTGYLYSLALRDLQASTIILIGVAHKARKFGVENKLVFDNFSFWNGPYGKVKESILRSDIIYDLPANSFIVHDSLPIVEHSLEAEIPFLQYYNKKVEIVTILVPYMNFDTMNVLAQRLATTLQKVMKKRKLVWGKDVAIVISSDAVHYGDEEWGGKNFARFGTDSIGYKNAVAFEKEIISNCIEGELKPTRVKQFTEYTVQNDNYKEYKWTWCGRYSVPFGMLTTYYLNERQSSKKIQGFNFGYSTSLQNKHLPVADLGMGVTAVCNLHHWVGYFAGGFK